MTTLLVHIYQRIPFQVLVLEMVTCTFLSVECPVKVKMVYFLNNELLITYKT